MAQVCSRFSVCGAFRSPKRVLTALHFYRVASPVIFQLLEKPRIRWQLIWFCFDYRQQLRFKTYCVQLHSRMYAHHPHPDQLPSSGGFSEPTSILKSPIGEVDEAITGSPTRQSDRQSVTAPSSGVVQRSTSDRYSYHAAMSQQQTQIQNNANY
jgi:hypothetical protein